MTTDANPFSAVPLPPYTITQREAISHHEWAIAVAVCDLSDDNDCLLTTTVDLVRRSYGEGAVMSDAEALMSEEIVSGTFNLEHLRTAFREGLPDPNKEGNKPAQLTNYRSQSAEMAAKAALAQAYNLQYPAAPQEGATNPNQPILGFDGWGILQTGEDSMHFALIQVKATDATTSPPPDSVKLADECRRAPTDRTTICRALSAHVRFLRGDPLQRFVFRILESLGRGGNIPIVVSPVVVRGTTTASFTDLDPIISIVNDSFPIPIKAIVVSIGASLSDFGHRVMSQARRVT